MTETLLENEKEMTIDLWAHPTLEETQNLISKLKDIGYKVIHHHSYRSSPAISHNGKTLYGLKNILDKYLKD